MTVAAQYRIADRTLLAKSCTRCGCFKQASDFPRSKKRLNVVWSSFCRTCTRASIIVSQKKHNEQTRALAKCEGNEWTDSEMATLEAMTRDGLSAKKIALALGRSTSAVYMKRHHMKEEV